MRASPQIVRDGLGNALGGIRMPSIAVPTARHTGFARDGSLDLFGSTDPFDEATLAELYPTKNAYTAAVRTAAVQAMELGALLARDAKSYGASGYGVS